MAFLRRLKQLDELQLSESAIKNLNDPAPVAECLNTFQIWLYRVAGLLAQHEGIMFQERISVLGDKSRLIQYMEFQ